jgi:hypothetical protein
MKQKILFRNIFLTCLVSLGISSTLTSEVEIKQLPISLEKQSFSSKPLYEVASVGAPTTGSLVEGSVGSINRGCRHRFYCHSAAPAEGFLGPQEAAKPVSLKDQPGVFPAPLVGDASVTFQFYCQNPKECIIPVVIRPDGTIYQGLIMTSLNSPQTIVIASPAQTGIYTLFVLAKQQDSLGAHVTVDASISTQPQNITTFSLKTFEPNDKEGDLISAEFIYTPS